MVKVPCRSCAKVLRFQEKYLGRQIHCPQCGHPQLLSESSDVAATLTPPGRNGPRVSLKATPSNLPGRYRVLGQLGTGENGPPKGDFAPFAPLLPPPEFDRPPAGAFPEGGFPPPKKKDKGGKDFGK